MQLPPWVRWRRRSRLRPAWRAASAARTIAISARWSSRHYRRHPGDRPARAPIATFVRRPTRGLFSASNSTGW